MSYLVEFDRSQIKQKPLHKRQNKVYIENDYIHLDAKIPPISQEYKKKIQYLAGQILRAKQSNTSIILNFGAHAIKNGLGPLLVEFIRNGWISHLATNGAGIIHDWEFAYQGASSEAVYTYLPRGEFGTWHETGFFINLAIIVGTWEGLGYGSSIGKMLVEGGLRIPPVTELQEVIQNSEDCVQVSLAGELLYTIQKFRLVAGWMEIAAPYKRFSLQAGAYVNSTPSTSHPMFGHDIIYTHDINNGAAIGHAAEHDFLSYIHSVANLHQGVLLSVGSAVMSPLLFEKAYSMVRNTQIQKSQPLNYTTFVVDLAAQPRWNWEQGGEAPMTQKEYNLSHIQIFNRCNPKDYHYLSMDNRNFFLTLYKFIKSELGQ